MISWSELIKSDHTIRILIEKGNENLGAMGFSDHGIAHVSLVSALSSRIMQEMGYDSHLAELASIAGYMHDIGNVVNRNGHSQSGALMAMELLRRLGMEAEDIALIAGAIGNHDEGTGQPVSEVAAALILADKSHVHRKRVRNKDVATFDIHDRVNYAVQESKLIIEGSQKLIAMNLNIDIEICPVMEYFEIFLSRMLLCRKAADFLGCEFALNINNAKLL
jgi:HD superfamily phosphodiesterase